MPKAGILHDYDLYANNEPSARKEGVVCAICDASPPSYQWSDYSGEAMCMKCGCPYQLKWGSAKQKAENRYPYLKLAEEWIPIIRGYWQETHRWTCFGMMLGPAPGAREFNAWVKAKHPELIDKKEDETHDGTRESQAGGAGGQKPLA